MEILKWIESIGIWIIGIFVAIAFICGVIGVFVHKKRYGSYPKCQGYGQD